MSGRPLWDAYASARSAFISDPSPENEGRIIAAHAEWARRFYDRESAFAAINGLARWARHYAEAA